MANILCFGDSNTWGTPPAKTAIVLPNSQSRYSSNERWTGLLHQALKHSYQVVEEGQPSRTLVHNSPFDGDKTGIRYLKNCLEQYSPQLTIIMLGTNDLKNKYALCAKQIGQGLSTLVKQAQNFIVLNTNIATKILLICPPTIDEVGHYAKMYAGGAEKSKQLAQHYQQCANELNCTFVDANTIITSSKEDGVHWPVDQHQLFANALLPIIKKLINHEDLQRI